MTRIPCAIAPLVTTITSSPARWRDATVSQTPARTSRRGSPRSSATIEEPSLTTTRLIAATNLDPGMQLEDDAADLDVVARLEAGVLQGPHHPDALEGALHVSQRLVVV